MKYLIVEFHKGLFNLKTDYKPTVSSFNDLDRAKVHYNTVKDNCQKIVLTEVLMED